MTRTESAKINGALSHGPTTEAGKAVSSRNAIKHGLTAREIVLSGEDPRAFDLLLRNICVDHAPSTVREHDLAFEMAAARWRLRRLAIMEKATIQREIRRLAETRPDLSPEDIEIEAWASAAESDGLKQVHRHETRLRRAYEKARTELEALVEARMEIESGEKLHPCSLELVHFAGEEPGEQSAVQNEPNARALTVVQPGASAGQSEQEMDPDLARAA